MADSNKYTCVKCHQKCNNTGEQTLQCSNNCGNVIHTSCSGLKQRPGKRNQLTWSCEDCVNTTGSPATTPPVLNTSGEPSLTIILQEIQAINAKITVLTPIKEELAQIKESQEFLSSQFDELHQKIAMIPELETKVNKLQVENSALRDELHNMQNSIMECEAGVTVNANQY